jgi:hypothetical protein
MPNQNTRPFTKTDLTTRDREIRWDSETSTYDYRQGQRRADISIGISYRNDELLEDYSGRSADVSFLVAGRQRRENWCFNREELLGFAEMFKEVASHLPETKKETHFIEE